MGDQGMKEVLGEVVGETQDTLEAKPELNPEDKSNQKEGETQSGDTPDYIKGIDINKYLNKLPEQDRPKFKELFSEAVGEGKGLLDKGYQEKFKEVASLKKAQEDLGRLGLSVQEARTVLTEHLKNKTNPNTANTQKKEASKLLDQLIDNSPNEQRKSLEQLRQIVLEETDTTTLKEQVKTLQNQLNSVLGYTQESRRSSLEQDLVPLQDKYGKDFIDKWGMTLVNKALEHNVPLTKVMQIEIPFDELEEAILATSKPEQKKIELTQDKKNAISSKGSGVTSSLEMVDIKKDWKSFLTDITKK